MRKITGYVIGITPNYGSRMYHGRYFKKSDANKELRKLLSKAKGNKTAYRDALSGTGVNNPRIRKTRFFR